MQQNDRIGITTEVFTVLKDGLTGEVKRVCKGHNLITTAGATYYAQMGAGETPAHTTAAPNFSTTADIECNLTNGTLAPAVGTEYDDISAEIVSNGTKAGAESGYPTTNDGSGDNPGTPGVNVVTYKFTYTTGTVISGANDVFICHKDASTAGDVLLNHAVLDNGPVSKGTNDTLDVYVNHTFA